MMEHLKAQKTGKKLRNALNELPSDLDAMFNKTIGRSGDRMGTLRLLSWVLHADESLVLEAIPYAVAWTLDATEPLDSEDLETEDSLMYSCGGLVNIRKDGKSKNTSEVIFTRECHG